MSFEKKVNIILHISYWSCRKLRVYEKMTTKEEDFVFVFGRNESTMKRERMCEIEERDRAGRCVKASAHTFVWWVARQ